jgi:hypothetical protein
MAVMVRVKWSFQAGEVSALLPARPQSAPYPGERAIGRENVCWERLDRGGIEGKFNRPECCCPITVPINRTFLGH